MALLVEAGARPFKIQGGGHQEVGIPDILVCYRGQFIGLEAKMPGGKVSPRQALVMKSIRDAGGIAVVFTAVDQVELLLARIKGRS